MIEQDMIFALGFVTAGLVALACLPAVWHRAIRLTTRRLRQLVPLSGEEIVAERDQLRAMFAVEQRRLEQMLERSEAVRTTLLADLGRKEAQSLTLEGEVTRAVARNTGLSDALEATQRELHGMWAGAGTAEIALHDLTGLAETRRWELLAAEAKLRDLETVIDEGRASIAAFETRILGLETRMTDLGQALGNSRAELARTVDAVGRASAERDLARRAAEALQGERDNVRIERDRAAADIEQGLQAARLAERRLVEAAQATAAQRATIDELRSERDTLAAQLAMGGEARRAAAETIDGLRGETAALEAKLMDLQARPTPTAADVAVLRDAIRRVSEDVLRLTGEDALGAPGSGASEAAGSP